jgi:hypothetical protein
MASSFKNYTARSIGITPTAIEGYVVPAATQVTAIGLVLSNTTNATIKVSAMLNDGTNDTYIVKNMDIIPGSAQVIIGGDQKIVMEAGDSIKVVSDTATSLDAILSVLELT